MLGFLFRICNDFDDLLLLKVLYYAHVRSLLEYACIVWFPNFSVHVKRIESIQKRFMRYIFSKFGYLQFIKVAPYEFKLELIKIDQQGDGLFVYFLCLICYIILLMLPHYCH